MFRADAGSVLSKEQNRLDAYTLITKLLSPTLHVIFEILDVDEITAYSEHIKSCAISRFKYKL